MRLLIYELKHLLTKLYEKTNTHLSIKIRKIIFSVLGFLLFGVILNLIFGIFRFPLITIHSYEAIPNHTAVIFEPGHFSKDSFSIEHLELFKELSFARQLRKDQELMTDLFGDSILIENKSKTLVTFQNIGEANLDFLYVFDIKNLDLKAGKIKERIKGFKNKNLKYLGESYKTIQIKDQAFTLYNYRNLILVSRYPVLVEDGIRQLKNYRTCLSFDADFKKLSTSQKSGDASKVFVNFKQLPKQFNSFFKYENRKVLNAIPNFASWMAIDLHDFSKSEISGQYVTPQPFKARKNLKGPQEMDVLQIIPDNTGFLFAQQGIHLRGMKDSIFQKYVGKWMEDEWALAVVNPKTSADRLLFVKAKNKNIASHYLGRFGTHFGELDNSIYQTYPIVQLLGNNCLDPFLNHLQLELPNPFYTVIDDFVVFSNSKQSLETAIDKNIVGQTIFKNEAFLTYINSLSNKSNALMYSDGASAIYILEKMLHHNLTEQLTPSVLTEIKNFRGGLEFYNGKEVVPFNIKYKIEQSQLKETEVVWRTAFAADVISSPKPIWNKQTQEYEILVQDKLHNLYLLNNNGEILWKRTLSDALLSEIYEIDYHEDGELKLLFNTADNIYLLDREGKDIGNYPLHLQSPASNGMCLVDFEQNKKYKMFLACENGQAYGFTKEGNPVFGWNPKHNVGRITQAFQYFQDGRKDYLVLLNDEGKLATFNSKGKREIKKLTFGDSFQNTPEILNLGKKKVIALTNNKGVVKIINNRGHAYNLSLDRESKAPVKYAFANITGDYRKDFVTLSNNKVACYSPEKKKLKQQFEIVLNEQQDELFEVKSNKKGYSSFGTLSRSKKTIYLFDAQNALHKDFPLAGTTPFSMIDLYGNEGKVLLVGFENSLYAYQIAKSK